MPPLQLLLQALRRPDCLVWLLAAVHSHLGTASPREGFPPFLPSLTALWPADPAERWSFVPTRLTMDASGWAFSMEMVDVG